MIDQASYDPNARRDTPLARLIADQIRRDGPMSVADYMQLCLQHPEHGYYRSKAVLGAAGDFVTAPEISQMFGELIGLWAAVVWQQMGSPPRVNLIELGPGRGTLLADALRAVRRVPGFLDAAAVTCVEISEALQVQQRMTLAGISCPVQWCARLDDVATGPSIILANEFLDALPASQSLVTGHAIVPRQVGLDGADRLVFLPGELDTSVGDIDTSQARAFQAVLTACAARVNAGPLAALFIDYGHTATARGDTLQAVRAHAYEHPLTSPGEADLTVHVDFEAFASRARALGLVVDGPTTQAEFLGRLGLVERASKMMAANAQSANAIEMAVARLIGPGAMGTRFKAIGLRAPSLPPLPALA
jgi:NADH dehydrogenase [ubiquinone] 1 alpha subcomplex assembly factor 7